MCMDGKVVHPNASDAASVQILTNSNVVGRNHHVTCFTIAMSVEDSTHTSAPSQVEGGCMSGGGESRTSTVSSGGTIGTPDGEYQQTNSIFFALNPTLKLEFINLATCSRQRLQIVKQHRHRHRHRHRLKERPALPIRMLLCTYITHAAYFESTLKGARYDTTYGEK